MPTRKKATALNSEFINIGIEEAKEIVGWKETDSKEDSFRYTDENGNPGRFILERNTENRRLNLRQVEKYADKMLRGLWAGQANSGSSTCNGESWIVGSNSQVISCAHRCVAVIFAEMQRKRLVAAESEKVDEWGLYDAVSVPALLVTGIDPPAADSNDLARKRANSDIIFRLRPFSNGKQVNEATQQRLSKELATAAQRTWGRVNGYRVNGCPEFTPEDCRAFLKEHPLLEDCIWHMYHENGSERLISKFVPLGVAAASMYLMGHTKSDRKKLYHGELDLSRKPKMWSKAETFWTLFAGGKHSEDNGILALHKVLGDNRASEDKYQRDAIQTLIFRAWQSWIGEESGWKTARALKSKLYVKAGDSEVLSLLRLGGFDYDREILVEMGVVDDAPLEVLEDLEWKVGDTCWVNQEGEDAWFGEITDLSGKTATVLSKDDSEEYTCKVDSLSTEEPVTA